MHTSIFCDENNSIFNEKSRCNGNNLSTLKTYLDLQIE